MTTTIRMNRKLALVFSFLVALPLLAETRQRYTVTTNGAMRAFAMRVATHAAGQPALRVRMFENLDGFAADLSEAEAAALRATPGVELVQPVVTHYASAVETYDHQVMPWGVPVIHAPEVWPVTKGKNVNVVVIDTGIDLTHPDLKKAYVGGHNVLNAGAPPMDDNFHGTHVAGIIAATDNEFGVVGIAPEVKLWAVKALDQAGQGDDSTIAAAFDWVISKKRELGGRWVVNCSFGARQTVGKLEENAVQQAIREEIVVVASAGNDDTRRLEFPAGYPGVIAVGAVGEDGNRADFSNYGDNMSIVAPGVGVQSALLQGFLDEGLVVVDGQAFEAHGVQGTPKTKMSGRIVDCKLGYTQDFPAAVAGNIALIRRGEMDFREKARNAKNAGAVAVVIYDNQTAVPILWKLYLQGCPDEDTCPEEWRNYRFPLTVGISKADGELLLTKQNKRATASFLAARYGRLNGTSMAAPHVVSAAALLLSLDPTLRPSEVARVLLVTARDTAEPGWDVFTGFGIVDALAAAKYVAPEKFQVPPPSDPPKRRTVRR